MPQRTIQVSNKLGLHARASAKLTKLAGQFSCDIFISKGSRRVNAKSIMGVMMLAAGIGSTVTVDAEGDQADIALDAVQALFDDKFGEGE
ncbi:HPr family phosphocarrier protein [Thiomonas bhubaneswarensis]|uniref:Phosphotransferase System HPr (HPr) Family n=1 Tax=Thiomonas bhubaneswarensis TaxID=339866 RepID=A0A0K6HVE0_9BURK|nr:HPr family phosphocarrier protein [Thiomonas bhubaneswarensis]CUA94806.1 Phosphotransferase System HPr (HPr) Family [Thiomonas bhubaneswarensis]